MRLDRRKFLGSLSAAAGLALAPRVLLAAEAGGTEPAVHDGYPSHDPTSVRDVVAASHGNIDRVRELVEVKPELAKASWDWGFGDWETALGAASHMGRRDIADLLISHGARPNLFTHAMRGDLGVVRSAVAAMPGIQSIPGPHGISLLQHARAGGDGAAAVTDYLTELGDADGRATNLETREADKQRYLGVYVFGPGERDRFEVAPNRRGALTIKRPPAPFGRTLLRVEDHGFAPGGAPSVRVRFEVRGDEAVALTIHDPEPTIRARREP